MTDKLIYKFEKCGHTDCAPCNLVDYESREIDYVCDYLDRVDEGGMLNGAFIDVGAHAGLWSLQMSEWYRNRYNVVPSILALEPDDLNFIALKKNAEQADTGIHPLKAAAWNKDIKLFFSKNSIPARHRVFEIGVSGRTALRVQGVSLDGMAKTKKGRQVDAIKIDVEGAELNVLNGAREILNANKQLLIVVEYSIDNFTAYGCHPKQVTAFMESHGFLPAREEDVQVTNQINLGELKRVIFVKGDII